MEIVFIDDQQEICDVFELILSSEFDAKITTFQDTISAKNYFDENEKNEISLIICDYMLPKENGLDFYQKVKDKDIPFIMLTGMLLEDDLKFKDFHLRERTKVLHKPVNEEVLIEEIKTLI